jgi:hypothetical protein
MIRNSMARTQSQVLTVSAIFALGFCFLTSLVVATASAYLFGPGKYCGVVVVDRWGTCYLVSGPSVNYVASDVKSGLFPNKGNAIEVDASKVTRGGLGFEDPMIQKYKILGPAPASKRVKLDGLQLLAVQAFGRYTRPQFLVEFRNNGKSPVRVDRSQIGVLLFAAEKPQLSYSNDDSVALISRTGLAEEYYISSSGVGNKKTSWGYIVDTKTQPPASFVIAPGQSVRTVIRFKLYPGQYQFMFAYGGGVSEEKSLVSNAISFDMNAEGHAKLAE